LLPSVQRQVKFIEKERVTNIFCYIDSLELKRLQESPLTENLWADANVCNIGGVRIYSTYDEVKNKFGEPKKKILITEERYAISTYVYKYLIFAIYKNRVVGIFFGPFSNIEVAYLSSSLDLIPLTEDRDLFESNPENFWKNFKN